MRDLLGPHIFLALALATSMLVATACTGSGDTATSDASEVTSVTNPTPATTGAPERDAIDERFDVVPEARASDGGGGPRPPVYWAVWNTCASDNRAAEAAANGGRAAGWVLVDDVLADPGIQLGDHLLTTCEESVYLLLGRVAAGEETSDPAYTLAAQLLAAELNLNVGAETCPIAEEAVLGAHLVLSSAKFDGVSNTPLDDESGGALPRLVDLLAAYNSGELCR